MTRPLPGVVLLQYSATSALQASSACVSALSSAFAPPAHISTAAIAIARPAFVVVVMVLSSRATLPARAASQPPAAGATCPFRQPSRLQHAEFPPDLRERGDRPVEVLARVRSRHLRADARLALR